MWVIGKTVHVVKPIGAIQNVLLFTGKKQFFVSGSKLDPFSATSWIRIRTGNLNKDLDPNWDQIQDPIQIQCRYLDPQH